MHILALICSAIGVTTLLGVGCFALWAFLSGGTEGAVFAVFIAFVLGIPAVGFAIFMFGLSATLGTAALVTAPSTVLGPEAGSPNVRRSKGFLWLSYLCFGAAILWSAPHGFFTFVGLVTDNPTQAASRALAWLGVAIPLIASGYLCRAFALRSNS